MEWVLQIRYDGWRRENCEVSPWNRESGDWGVLTRKTGILEMLQKVEKRSSGTGAPTIHMYSIKTRRSRRKESR